MRKSVKKKRLVVILTFAVLVVASAYFWPFVYKNFIRKYSVKREFAGFESTMGIDISLPDEYSDLIPIHPDSRIFSVIENDDRVVVATRVNSEDVKGITKWYEAAAVGMGYKIDRSSTFKQITDIRYSNDSYEGGVTLSNKDHSNPGKIEEEIRISIFLYDR